MKKLNKKKHSLAWSLSCRLSELDSESQEGLVRELMMLVPTKKIKELESLYFKKEEYASLEELKELQNDFKEIGDKISHLKKDRTNFLRRVKYKIDTMGGR